MIIFGITMKNAFKYLSTNIPSIGLVIPEITFEMLDFLENKHNILLSKTNARVQSVQSLPTGDPNIHSVMGNLWVH